MPSAVPRLLPTEFTLVKANSRISLTGTGAAAISAPLAGGAAAIGAEWAVRYAALLFVVGTILAILLPAQVDSSEGEEQVDLTKIATGAAKKGISISRDVVNGLRSNSGSEAAVGLPHDLHGVHAARTARRRWGGTAARRSCWAS